MTKLFQSRSPWWKSPRGEWYVVVQFGLFLLIALGPRRLTDWQEWKPPYAWVGTIAGSVLLLLGGLLAGAAALRLGRNLTPLPYPEDSAILVETGPFRFVRHPIYSGLIFMAFGWGLLVHGWLTLGYAGLLFLLLDRKSRREERWLEERFPGYASYRERTRRLIPFVY